MSNDTSTGSNPTQAAADPASPAGERARSGRASSDVRSLLALGLALPIYGVTVLIARAMPPGVRAILLERGWVCHAIMLLSCLALTILALKAVALRAQRRAFALEVLPPGEAGISPENVGRVIEHVKAQEPRGGGRAAPRSFLFERVLRILEHYAARADVTETAAINGAEGDADAAAVASSFSIVKVLVWAIPILGFIGTVIGIGDAVGGFSRSLEGAGQLDTIKTSLGDVTSGLAVAFDSTLVALVASILVMMPTSWLQKAEDQLVNDVDDHCVTNVLRRLASPVTAPPASKAAEPPAALTSEEIRRIVVETIAPQLGEMLAANTKLLARLAEDREALASAQTAMSEQLSAFAAAAGGLAPGIERAVVQLERATASAEQAAGKMISESSQLAARLVADREALSGAQSAMASSLSALAASSERMGSGVERAAAQVERAAGQLERATVLAEQTTTAAARAEEQLCRELGASRQLLSLLAAGLGAPGIDAPQPVRRQPNGANGANGAHRE